jgi:hypothetical protein
LDALHLGLTFYTLEEVARIGHSHILSSLPVDAPDLTLEPQKVIQAEKLNHLRPGSRTVAGIVYSSGTTGSHPFIRPLTLAAITDCFMSTHPIALILQETQNPACLHMVILLQTSPRSTVWWNRANSEIFTRKSLFNSHIYLVSLTYPFSSVPPAFELLFAF